MADPPGEISDAGRGWYTTQWDPRITQKAGFMLRQKEVYGLLDWPGPKKFDGTYDYYLSQVESFMRGFNGNDPGELLEVCNDGWDNNGDGLWNEGC